MLARAVRKSPGGRTKLLRSISCRLVGGPSVGQSGRWLCTNICDGKEMLFVGRHSCFRSVRRRSCSNAAGNSSAFAIGLNLDGLRPSGPRALQQPRVSRAHLDQLDFALPHWCLEVYHVSLRRAMTEFVRCCHRLLPHFIRKFVIFLHVTHIDA